MVVVIVVVVMTVIVGMVGTVAQVYFRFDTNNAAVIDAYDLTGSRW